MILHHLFTCRSLILKSALFTQIACFLAPLLGAQEKSTASTAAIAEISFYCKVYEHPDTASNVLTVLSRGDHYPIYHDSSGWLLVGLVQNRGWIEKHNCKVASLPGSSSAGQSLQSLYNLLFVDFASRSILIPALLLVLIANIVLFVKLYRKSKESFQKAQTAQIAAATEHKLVVYIVGKDKLVKSTVTEQLMTLSSLFTITGFDVERLRNVKALKARTAIMAPDIFAIDAQNTTNVINHVEQMISGKPLLVNIPLIFFNAPKTERRAQSRTMLKVFYFSDAITDTDIFRIASLRVATFAENEDVRTLKSVSALEGGISQESILETMQFIEVGRKSGLLVVKKQGHYGSIAFQEGIIVYAQTQRSEGKEAAIEMLDLKDGYFRFTMNQSPKERNCSLLPVAVLMEWTQGRDEEVLRS
ncbi:MAG: DUF4388 domain-containing protein [Chitinivibrionales bacterium]|nr:DUF4388 domain-containing protein [Chitinivibrionales bacterium]